MRMALTKVAIHSRMLDVIVIISNWDSMCLIYLNIIAIFHKWFKFIICIVTWNEINEDNF